MPLKPGDTFIIGGPRPSDANHVRGPGWEASRTGDDYELSFIAAAHGGHEERFAITAEEFALLREEPAAFDVIVSRREG